MQKNTLAILAFIQVFVVAQSLLATDLSSQIAEFSKTHPLTSSVRLQTVAEGPVDFQVTPGGSILGIHYNRLVFWKRSSDGSYAAPKGSSSWRAYDGTLIARVPNQVNVFDLYMGKSGPDRITFDEETGMVTDHSNPSRERIPGEAIPPGIYYDRNRNEKKVRLFSLAGELIRVFNNVEGGQPSFDNRHLFTVEGGALRAIDENGGVATAFQIPLEAGDSIYSVLQSPDGKYIAIGTRNGKLLVLDYGKNAIVMHGKQLNRLLNVVRFSDDARLLFTVGEGNEINIWNLSRLTVDRVLSSLPQQRLDAASALIKRFEAEEARLQRETLVLQLDNQKCWDALFSVIYN